MGADSLCPYFFPQTLPLISIYFRTAKILIRKWARLHWDAPNRASVRFAPNGSLSCRIRSDRLALKILFRGDDSQFMSTEPNKVIYSMVGVSKYYDKRAVLKDIYLSYFYGAKIGVIGLNGSGKSSLLAHHGGRGQRDQRRGCALAGLHGRLSGAGTVDR